MEYYVSQLESLCCVDESCFCFNLKADNKKEPGTYISQRGPKTTTKSPGCHLNPTSKLSRTHRPAPTLATTQKLYLKALKHTQVCVCKSPHSRATPQLDLIKFRQG